MNEIVGLNIKKKREQSNVSLRKLSQECGVSPSFLSQVEKGKAVPSLATLKRVADSLHTTIGVLVGEDGSDSEHGPLTRRNDRHAIEEIGQNLKIELLTQHQSFMQMESSLFTFYEDGTTGELSEHFGQEFVYVLAGKLSIILGKSSYTLQKEDSFYFDSLIPHAFINVNKGITRILRVITPPLF
jgi:transcriptional regulator with XRE-family HTH domain